MFIDSIDIKEFRGIKCLVEPIRFSRINILFGRNNAGKTTILDALSLLPKPDIEDPIMRDKTNRDPVITGKNKIDILSNIHNAKQKGYRALLRFYAGRSEIKYVIENEEYFLRINENNFELSTPTGIIQDNKEIYRIFKTIEINNLVIYIPFNTNYFNIMEQRIEDLQYQINKYGYNVKIAKLINQSLDDKYSEIIFRDRIVLRKILGAEEFNYVELKDLGTGAEKVIKIMALVEILKPKLLLIDDFAAGLHPSLIDIFLNWLEEKELQSIVTTHSIDVLYRLTKMESEDIQILFLKKSQNDILSFKIYSPIEIENYLDTNTDPRVL